MFYLFKHIVQGMQYIEPGLDGFRLCFSGRFNRKQRATYRWKRVGRMPLNTATEGIDYAFGVGRSKFGLFGIKVWLCYESDLLIKKTAQIYEVRKSGFRPTKI